jgi:hypothetical protein
MKQEEKLNFILVNSYNFCQNEGFQLAGLMNDE